MEGNLRRKEQNYLLGCKSKFNSHKIFNLFEVTEKISIIRFKKLEQIQFLHAILRPCFLQKLAFFFSCIF